MEGNILRLLLGQSGMIGEDVKGISNLPQHSYFFSYQGANPFYKHKYMSREGFNRGVQMRTVISPHQPTNIFSQKHPILSSSPPAHTQNYKITTFCNFQQGGY
jgi:hypothetical protein